MNIFIGTSGYGYKPWKGKFYPKDLPEKEMLKYYSSSFNSVEINNTFYSMPTENTIKAWQADVPNDFRFFIKAPSKITHIKRLKNCTDELKYFIDTCSTIGKSLSGFLFQLPPNYKKNISVLDDFISLIPRQYRAAFEFRHESWYDDETYTLLSKHDYALCTADTDELPIEKIISTASWGYLRLRQKDYDKKALKSWYTKILKQNWEDVFIYFKHEDKANGPRFANILKEIIAATVKK